MATQGPYNRIEKAFGKPRIVRGGSNGNPHERNLGIMPVGGSTPFRPRERAQKENPFLGGSNKFRNRAQGGSVFGGNPMRARGQVQSGGSVFGGRGGISYKPRATGGYEGLDGRIANLPGIRNRDSQYIRDRGGLATGVDRDVQQRRGQYQDLQNQFSRREGHLASRQRDADSLDGGLARRGMELAGRRNDGRARQGERADRLSAYGQLDNKFGLGNDFGAQRDRSEQASFERARNLLGDDFNNQEARLRQRLQNQGLAAGSEAYETELNRFSKNRDRRLNDLALGSVAAGGAEHSRLSDILSRNRAQLFGEGGQLFSEGGQIENERARRFQEGDQVFQNKRQVFSDRGRLEDERARHLEQGRGVFDSGNQLFQNALQGSQFGEGLNKAQEAENQRGFNRDLAARGQLYGEQRDANQVANQNRDRLDSQNFRDRSFAHTAGLQNRQFEHSSGLDRDRLDLSRDQFQHGSDLQNRQFDFNSGLQNRQLDLSNRQLDLNSGLARDQFQHGSNLQNRQFDFNSGLARDQFQHGSNLENRQFDFNSGLQNRQFDLNNRQFDFNSGLQRDQFQHGSNLQNRQFNLDERGQRFNQGLARDNFGLQRQGQFFDQGLQRGNFDNSWAQRQFDNQFRNRQFDNSVGQQQFNQEQILRNQGIREMMMAREDPYNQLRQLLGLSGNPQNPNFGQQTPWSVPAPDVGGSYGNILGSLNQGSAANNGMIGDALGQMPWGDIWGKLQGLFGGGS